LTLIKADVVRRGQDRAMDPPENPPENLRTRGDRLAEVSPLLWSVLAAVTVMGFIALALFLTSSLNG